MNNEKVEKALEYCACLHKAECTKCAYLQLKNETYNCTIELAKETLLYIRQLKEEIVEWEDLFGVCNNREWRKKFNEEIWEKELGHGLSTPDFDFVYELFFKQREELNKLKENK